ncbi:MAG: PQQ-like beta-propeller repeat protein [Pirellulaceae bacterium]|nr:PQQ-like beta-propeller repeat protein [Pirellulaceae bacterium]
MATLLVLISCSQKGWADDWPQWLGPRRDSVWRETGILERFPQNGPPLRWKTTVSGGYSGPAVANGRVFVMDWVALPQKTPPKNLNTGEIPKNHNFVRELHPGTERVVCLRERDGIKLWQHTYRCDYTTVSTYAIGPRCTPTIDGNRVFTLGAEGHLICFDVTDGTVVWSRNFVEDYKLTIPEWGIAAHPLVDGEQLICVVGGKDSVCIAFDKRTGQERWRALDARQPGYCAPMIYEIAGKRQLLIWHSDSINAIDPESGELYWSVPFESTFAMSIGVPRLSNHRLFIMSFHRQSAAIDIAQDGLSAEIAWRGSGRKGVGGVMNNAFLQDGHIFACGEGGRYTCVNLDTGDRLWTTYEPTSGKRPVHWGSAFTIRHKDRFFIANDFGDLIIARLSPLGYEEVSRAHLITPTHNVGSRTLVWSHPAFANRSVYLRNDKELRCYSLQAKSETN